MNTTMKTREIHLREILGGKTLPFGDKKALLTSSWVSEIYHIYKKLGGILDTFPMRVGHWDVFLDRSIAEKNLGFGREAMIELDEEQHFNQYRLVTLEASFYSKLIAFPIDDYRLYRELHEDDALRRGSHGGYWTNKAAERQFGQAGVNGILIGNGAPRWKQRAFYDMLKDLASLIIDIPLARISVWDYVHQENETTETVGDILKLTPDRVSTKQVEALKKLVSSRFSRRF